MGLRLGGRHFGLDVVERRLKLDVFGRRVLLVRAATSGPEFVHSSTKKHGADGGGGDDGENDTDACRKKQRQSQLAASCAHERRDVKTRVSYRRIHQER